MIQEQPENPTTSSLSAVQMLEHLIQQAQTLGASDVHLQMTGKTAQVQFRLDGVMVPASVLPEDLADRVFGRVKYLARLKTYQESLPQEGRIDKSDLGCPCDLRVSTYPTVTGEKIVLRLFQVAAARTLAELGLAKELISKIEGRLRQNSGLILLTGPAGSGKTTTIYACLRFITQQGGRHIITVEDPVEQVVPGIMQTEVNEAIGLDFAKAAKHLLRQDPQVLVIGEIRDEETANLAVRASLTGHLVIATLHAGSCQGVYERLLVMCPDRYAATSSVTLVANQRLMRRLCRDCHGAKCPACLHTGYLGRFPILEWFIPDDASRERIRSDGPSAVQLACTLEQSAREVWQQGLSDETEYRRIMGM
jgi:type II secretory ATPase GspE/PulE/Tfp pilus assembly ATPase PilB-like protein